MKYFHFISIDNTFLAEINTKGWTNAVVKLHTSQEKFTSYFEATSENFVFLDVDSNTELENVKSIVKLNEVTSKVIVISKDTAFAYRAIKAGVHDYILKSNLINDASLVRRQLSKSIHEPVSNKIAIHCNDAVHYLSSNEIIRCKAESNYTWIIMKGKSILIAKTLGKIEALLPSAFFYRTHRSHIVNLKHIKMVRHEKGGTIVTSDDFNTPISRNRKNFFWDKIQLITS